MNDIIKYCIWDNENKDRLICLDKTAEDCCKILGVTMNHFRVIVTRSKQKRPQKYHIERSDKI